MCVVITFSSSTNGNSNKCVFVYFLWIWYCVVFKVFPMKFLLLHQEPLRSHKGPQSWEMINGILMIFKNAAWHCDSTAKLCVPKKDLKYTRIRLDFRFSP